MTNEKIVKLTTILEGREKVDFSKMNDVSEMIELLPNIWAYPNDNGEGFIIDTEEFSGRFINDSTMWVIATNCYYWRNEKGEIQFEEINYISDPDQHKRQVEAGHHVIYDTMYLITPAVITPDMY